MRGRLRKEQVEEGLIAVELISLRRHPILKPWVGSSPLSSLLVFEVSLLESKNKTSDIQ